MYYKLYDLQEKKSKDDIKPSMKQLSVKPNKTQSIMKQKVSTKDQVSQSSSAQVFIYIIIRNPFMTSMSKINMVQQLNMKLKSIRKNKIKPY